MMNELTSLEEKNSSHRDTRNSSKPLRIFKGFSELPTDRAAREIEKVSSFENEVTVVCANEGRSRAVLKSATAGSPFKNL